MTDLVVPPSLGGLGPFFCLTFVKGADEARALLAMGAYPDSLAERDGRELTAPFAAALRFGSWSVVIEPRGAHGADEPVLRAVSRGTSAVSVLRNDDGEPFFGYAVDGTVVAAFNPGYPAEEAMWGAEPGQLHHLLPAVGLREPTEDDERSWELAVPRAVLLAQKITGVALPADPLAARVLSGQVEPWFVTGATGRDLLRAGRRDPRAAAVVAAAEAAPPEVQRAVAAATVRRLAATLGVADAPGLDEALDAAAHGRAEPVAVDSPLGRQVRAWLAAGEHGPFLAALRGVLDPDPRVAILAALRPLPDHAEALAALGRP